MGKHRDNDHAILDEAIALVKGELKHIKQQEELRQQQEELRQQQEALRQHQEALRQQQEAHEREMQRDRERREQQEALALEERTRHDARVAVYYNDIKDALVDKTGDRSGDVGTHTVSCKTSYDRLCIYAAIEKLERDTGLTFRRIKVRERVKLDVIRCKKHWLPAYGSCDCCSDPYCCGPFAQRDAAWAMVTNF